jgi:Tir chaperone protein (CesT) family
MDAMAKVNDLLGALGEFHLDESRSCIIQHTSGVQVSIEVPQGGEFATFYSLLVELPPENSEPLLKRALGLNVLQSQIRGGAVAFDPRNGWIVFNLSVDVEPLDEIGFSNALGNFVDITSELIPMLSDDAQHAGDSVSGANVSGKEPSSGDPSESFLRV